jgi:uncharacterized membrane protein YphA (DoxX/SURF4 family)
MKTHSSLDQVWWALRLTYGLVAFLAGLDKFFNLLADWEAYLAPAVSSLLPFSAGAAMHTAGIIEMLVGILILTGWTRIGAYVASAWLLSIAFNLVLAGSHFDVAVRDVALAVGAWALARVTEVLQPEGTTVGTEATASSVTAGV